MTLWELLELFCWFFPFWKGKKNYNLYVLKDSLLITGGQLPIGIMVWRQVFFMVIPAHI